MNWKVASDIGVRIRELRRVLGGGRPIVQEELGRRAGVRISQVSQWERGVQRPSRSRLERWAEREGWPIEMFQEGGPMPSVIFGPAEAEISFPTPTPTPAPSGPDAVLARFYEVMAEASRDGRPCPAELAVLIQGMYELACQKPGSAPLPLTPDRASAGASAGGGTTSDVPGW